MGTHRAWWQRGVSSNNFETAMRQHLLLIVMMRVTLDAHDDEGDYKHRHHLPCPGVGTIRPGPIDRRPNARDRLLISFMAVVSRRLQLADPVVNCTTVASVVGDKIADP